MFDTKRLIGGVLAAGVLAVLPAPALSATPGVVALLPAPALSATPGVVGGFTFGQRCTEEWQLVNYGLFFYLQAPSAQGKEQLLHEINTDLRVAAFECGAIVI
jgi:hypothetical protein